MQCLRANISVLTLTLTQTHTHSHSHTHTNSYKIWSSLNIIGCVSVIYSALGASVYD